MGCSNKVPNINISCCSDWSYKYPKYTLQDSKCFSDGNYYGKVIYSDEKMIQVECDNGNKYMKGNIITFKLD